MMQPHVIAPSILSANFARLGDEVEQVLAAGADWIHLDVMDNHFVPNLSFGPLVCRALRKHGVSAPLDVHLMVEPAERLIDAFAEAGASYISFHTEAVSHVERTLNMIRAHGCKCGLAFNPATALHALQTHLPTLDLLLLMSVNPGFGGQRFIPGVMDKIRQARALLDDADSCARLEVDGGIGINNIAQLAVAGADTFVAGTAIFGTENYGQAITNMRAQLSASLATPVTG